MKWGLEPACSRPLCSSLFGTVQTFEGNRTGRAGAGHHNSWARLVRLVRLARCPSGAPQSPTLPQNLNKMPPLSAVPAPAWPSVATSTTTEPALPELPPVTLGRYRHYKGQEYEVLGVVRHSESLEPLVLYRPLYNASGLWVRPYAMFLETVDVGGEQAPRFALIASAEGG